MGCEIIHGFAPITIAVALWVPLTIILPSTPSPHGFVMERWQMSEIKQIVMSSLNFIRDLFKSKDSDTQTTLHAPTVTEISIYPGSGPQTILITTSGSGAVDVVVVDTKTSNASSLPSGLPDLNHVQSTSEDCSIRPEKTPSLWAESCLEKFNSAEHEHDESQLVICTTSYSDDGAECYLRSAKGITIQAACNLATDEYVQVLNPHQVPEECLIAELAPEYLDIETGVQILELMTFVAATLACQRGASPPPYGGFS
ncbi:hypothetical protein BDN70DRAFT_893475 [Pholiota conissans]|uniref:Uncharacterized protein n=1 Tax=Pholiota conissans TaxID=109636 RepID=A0A9P5Z4F4_9AGAR|nr:hypothetical protein BDN70DRAFT_893475 [Pholiota conissans]